MAENKASYLSSAHETVGKSRSGNSTESQLPIALNQLPDPSDRFELKSKIGEGTYGAVFCAQDRSTQELVAIKQVKRAQDLVEEIEVELAILEGFEHENLPKFLGAFLQKQATDNVLWFAIELCSYGSVSSIAKHLVRAGTRFNDAQIYYILHETLQALQFLHSHKVIHRDVKGKNVLLTDTCHVKLIDFGISRRMNSASKVYTSIGTPYWIAPEVIMCGDTQVQSEGYDTRADIWGVGILTFELVTGSSPYAGVSVPKALKRITQEEPPILQNVAPELSCFAAACLTKDYRLRPNASGLLASAFLAEQGAHRHKEAVRQQLGDICRRLKQEQLTETDRELTKVWHLRTDSCKNIENAQVHIGKRPQDAPQQAAKRRQELNMDDLSKLGVLDETNMLASLNMRFAAQSIYTYVGDILVALNPLSPLPIYNERVADKYLQTVMDTRARRSTLVPHIYAVALRAYEDMVHARDHQCIVINGESGAGKTESAKHTVAQLLRLGSAQNKNLEERILQTSPLLEAFGNAKTIIHQNSSRFGKYLEMIFSSTGKILGARMSQYLLEKSRVVRLAKDEGTFHIFYYLFDAFCLKDRALATFNLDPYVAYRYLGGLNRVISTKQREENFWRFQTVKRCLETVGFGEQDSQAMFAAIAAIIHAGNLNFEQIDVGSSCNSACKIENGYLLNLVCSLLAINAQELSDALTTTTITARTETIIRQNNVEEAEAVRDALAKTLYSRLFTWIVRQINEMLKPAKAHVLVRGKYPASNLDEALEEADSDEASLDCTLIGILDIFGFENFPTNSFEQLCINITNEQLQYYFNQHIFALEIEEMRAEGIQIDAEINFTDNRPVLDVLLGKPLGILNLVDEECNFPKASDLSLVQKLGRNMNNENFSRSKSDNTLFFAVHHYAGRVEYCAAGFIEKNRDWLPFQLSEVMRRSEIPLIRALFTSSIMRSVSEHVVPQVGHAMHHVEGLTSTFTSGIPSAISTPSIAFTSGIQSTASSGLASKLHSGQSSVGCYSVASRVSQSRAQQTMASYFRNSLIDLLTKMIACQPHFVRCIRPNVSNEVRLFDEQHVLRQLRHCGLLETIRIRQKGFSHRFTYSDFVEKYRVLLLPSRHFHDALGLGDFGFDNENSYKRFAQMIVDRIQLKNYRLGKTKLFLKHFHIATLMERFETVQRKIVTIQALVRGFLLRRRQFRALNERGKKAIKVQKIVRGFLARKHYRALHDRRAKAAITITKSVRGYLVHKHYVEMLEDRLVEAQWQMRASRRQRVRNSVRPEEERNHLLSALANCTLFLRSRFARESLKKLNPRARQPAKLEPVKELVSAGSMVMYNRISTSRRNRRASVRCYKHTGLASGVNAQYYNTIAELKRQSCPSVAFNGVCKSPVAAGSSNQSTSSSGVFSNATNSNSLPLRLPTIAEGRGEQHEDGTMTAAQKDAMIERILLAVNAAKVLLSNKPVTRVSSSSHDEKTCLEVLLNLDKQTYPPVLSLISRDNSIRHPQHHDNASSSDDLSSTHLRRQNTVKQHEEHEHGTSNATHPHHAADPKTSDRDLFAEPPSDTAPFLNFVPSYADLVECEDEQDIDLFIDCAFNFDEDYRCINEHNIAV